MKNETATLGGGCFWCTEAIFRRLKGVKSVTSGYSGGAVENPTYEMVSSGSTGHFEVIQIEFDPSEISFDKILEVFWHTHDPTTLNRQGNDVGTQYGSVIFYHSDKQKDEAERLRNKLDNEKIFRSRIVTQILPFSKFYKAEDYHKDYFEKHGDLPYCSLVISPKVNKLLSLYGKDVEEKYR